MSELSKYKEVDDRATAGSVWFYSETYRFLHEGLKLIDKQLDAVVPEFTQIRQEFGIGDTGSSEFEIQASRIKRMIKWGDHHASEDAPSITINGVSWGTLRLLKAGGIAMVRKLEERRDALLKTHRIVPETLLKSIDEMIEKGRNKTEIGMLNGLKPADVLFELGKVQEHYLQPDQAIQPSPQKAKTVIFKSDAGVIVDKELRSRCLDLLRKFDEENNPERLDTVVREMSVILENRVRTLAKLKDKTRLMTKAFSPGGALLKFSEENDVQQNAYFLFQGYAGLSRNDVMHKLVTSYSRERVYQLLGFVDYLLFLLTQASIESGTDSDQE